MKILDEDSRRIFMCRIPILACIVVLSILLLARCSTIGLNLDSNWRDQEILIDGKNSEWLGDMLYFEEENISVGMCNDENFFYICMIAENPIIRAQMMRQGFTVWFDPGGGDEKTFGIKYPVGMLAMGVLGKMNPRGAREGEPDPEVQERAIKRLMTEIEILGPGKDRQRKLKVKEAKGIDIKMTTTGEIVVYELKVPLVHSEQHPYAVGIKEGNLIGVGMEIPKFDRNAMRKMMGGQGRGGSGMPGGGRMGGRGGMGMRGARGRQMPKGIKLWMTVKLASI